MKFEDAMRKIARRAEGASKLAMSKLASPRLNPPHAQKTLQSGLKSPDRLLELFRCPVGDKTIRSADVADLARYGVAIKGTGDLDADRFEDADED